MIKVSDLAVAVLADSLRASGVDPEKGLRLKKDADHVILELDTPKENERVIRHDGQAVLIINRDFEARFGDAIIDVEDTLEGPDLVIRRTIAE